MFSAIPIEHHYTIDALTRPDVVVFVLQDLKKWVVDKKEVEVVDMVLRIKGKLDKCESQELQLAEVTKQQLKVRLQDIICSLPEDLRTVLSYSWYKCQFPPSLNPRPPISRMLVTIHLSCTSLVTEVVLVRILYSFNSVMDILIESWLGMVIETCWG